ncbi:hypothetical protein PGT21_036359 [Puccinia graminis f. sp. tritici]|uniref:Uncharacterized protein n=1 Tax=Puccinia graminis f. sp. tritici TaxID=56615 RepID=A0A5B0PN86_PUCGR|nr:hypothetical protein PGT21_036359 [Puccinia graminis f. sp. tritici]
MWDKAMIQAHQFPESGPAWHCIRCSTPAICVAINRCTAAAGSDETQRSSRPPRSPTAFNIPGYAPPSPA